MKNSQLNCCCFSTPIVNANASTLTTPLNFTTTTRFGIKSQASKDARTISNAVDTLFKHIFPFIHLGEPPLWLLCSLATQCSQIFWGLLLCLFFSFFLIFPKWPIFVQILIGLSWFFRLPRPFELSIILMKNQMQNSNTSLKKVFASLFPFPTLHISNKHIAHKNKSWIYSLGTTCACLSVVFNCKATFFRDA